MGLHLHLKLFLEWLLKRLLKYAPMPDGIYTDILIHASEVFLFDPGGGITHKCQCTEPGRISSENC